MKIDPVLYISTKNSLCVAQTKQIFNDVSLKDRSCHLTCSIINGVLRNFAKFTGKHLCQKFFFNKVAESQSLWHRCFPVNFVKFLRTLFLQITPGRLPLKGESYLKNATKQPKRCCKDFRVIMKTYILIPSYTFHAWNLKLPQDVLIKH